jgi:ABC-type glutathione transport system ATPase component
VLSGLFGTLGVSDVVCDKDMKKALNLMEELHLKKKENRVFSTMSKGERHNVMIARALISNPEILVLDEPTSMLDISVQAQILQILRELQNSMDLTYLFITHDHDVASYMCDRVVTLDSVKQSP